MEERHDRGQGEVGDGRRTEHGVVELAEDRHAVGRSLHSVHGYLGLGVAHPDGCRQLRVEAAEPSIDRAAGGAGLAGGDPRVVAPYPRTRAGVRVLLEDLVDHIRHACGEHAVALDLRLLDAVVGEDDFLDRLRPVMDAAAGERRVGVGHLERVDLHASQHDRGNGVERTRDAHAMRHVDDLGGAQVEGELCVHGVVGSEGRLHQVDAPGVGVAERGDIPVPARLARPGDVERLRVVVRRGRVGALFDRGDQSERFHRRARLSSRLPGEVELGRLPIGARHHGAYVTRGGVDGDHGSGWAGGQGRLHGVDAGLLHPHVDRREDPQTALEDLARAVLVDELPRHVIDEVDPPAPCAPQAAA